VIKKIQNGELQGEMIEENGLKIQYVLLQEAALNRESPTSEEPRASAALPSSRNVEEGGLQAELHALREELHALRKLMEQCCERMNAES
jgi:hypothetical protein